MGKPGQGDGENRREAKRTLRDETGISEVPQISPTKNLNKQKREEQ